MFHLPSEEVICPKCGGLSIQDAPHECYECGHKWGKEHWVLDLVKYYSKRGNKLTLNVWLCDRNSPNFIRTEIVFLNKKPHAMKSLYNDQRLVTLTYDQKKEVTRGAMEKAKQYYK